MAGPNRVGTGSGGPEAEPLVEAGRVGIRDHIHTGRARGGGTGEDVVDQQPADPLVASSPAPRTGRRARIGRPAPAAPPRSRAAAVETRRRPRVPVLPRSPGAAAGSRPDGRRGRPGNLLPEHPTNAASAPPTRTPHPQASRIRSTTGRVHVRIVPMAGVPVRLTSAAHGRYGGHVVMLDAETLLAAPPAPRRRRRPSLRRVALLAGVALCWPRQAPPVSSSPAGLKRRRLPRRPATVRVSASLAPMARRTCTSRWSTGRPRDPYRRR